MKRECLPALPVRATKLKRHWSFTPRQQPFFDSRRLHRGAVDTCGATTKSRDGQGAAVTKAESERHARVVAFYEKTCNDTETRKMPCLASDSLVSPKECSAAGSRWLVRHLFVTLGLLSVTSTLAYCIPSASLRVIVATVCRPMQVREKGHCSLLRDVTPAFFHLPSAPMSQALVCVTALLRNRIASYVHQQALYTVYLCANAYFLVRHWEFFVFAVSSHSMLRCERELENVVTLRGITVVVLRATATRRKTSFDVRNWMCESESKKMCFSQNSYYVRPRLKNQHLTIRTDLHIWYLSSAFPKSALQLPCVCACIFCAAAFTVGPIGGVSEGTSEIEHPDGASADAEALPRPNTIFQREERSLPLQLNKEQRKAALLGLGKHQQIWPTFAHGKSKRGSIVVYRPLPPEAATEVYDPKSDLLIDAVLIDHLLQTIPPDTSFLVVIDLQHVADHIRASLAPRHLAALHKQSSLTQFVKSLHWQMIRMLFLRPLCEGVILINAPAILLQVQPILEYLLFYQRPGSLREVLSSHDRETAPNQNRESYFLQISEDENALHAAVDAAELPSEYAGKFAISPRVRTGGAGEGGSLSKDYLQSGNNFAEHGGHTLSSLHNLGNAPEHVALSQAISATLLELDMGEAPLTTRASGPASLTTATSKVRQQFRRQQGEYHHAVEGTLKTHNEMSAGGSIPLVEVKGPDPLHSSVVTPQQKNSYAALLEHGAREILMEEPQTHISVSKEGGQCGRAILPSDPFSTALRGVVPHAGSAPDVQEILSRAHSLRYDTSTAPSHVAQNFKPAHARRRSVLLEARGSGHRDRKDSETSTKSKMASSAQGHLRREYAARRTEDGRHQSSLRDQAHQGKKSNRKGRTDVHTSNHTEHATSMQPQKPTAPSDGQSLAPCRGVSWTARARLVASATGKTREAEKLMASRTCWGKCERKAHADKPHQPNFTIQKHASQESSSSRKKATSVHIVSDTNDGGRAIHRNPLVNSDASHESLEPDISDPERRNDRTDKSNSREISFYADDRDFISSNGGEISAPQAGPRFAENTVRRGDRKQADNSDCGSQDDSEDSIQPSEATWTEDTIDRFKDLRNSTASTTRGTHRLSQKSKPEDEETEYSQNGTGGPTTSSPWTGYFWTETEAAGIETFDDIS